MPSLKETELTEQIDHLKDKMDLHAKASNEYQELESQRIKLMKERTKERRLNGDNISTVSNSKPKKKPKEEDEYASLMKDIKEIEDSLKEEEPKEEEPKKEIDPEVLKGMVQDFQKEIREVSFAEQPVNEAITKQFSKPLSKETILTDIYKLRSAMGEHLRDDLKDKTVEDLRIELRETGERFRNKIEGASDMLAGLHVVGTAAFLNFSRPIVEEASFTFDNVEQNADARKEAIKMCYDDLIRKDPYIGPYLLNMSSGAIGLLVNTTAIAATSFTTNKKKFTKNQEK